MLTFDTERYTAGRTTVMGFAAMAVVWFHSAVVVPAGSAVAFFKLTGDIGVDLFLFASGVGVYFAVQKYETAWAFLRSRLRRVVLPYLCVFLPWVIHRHGVFQGGSAAAALKELTLLDFWTEGNLSCWYVAVILALYLVTPLYLKLWKRAPAWTAGAALVLALYPALAVPALNHLQILLFRVPIYLLGLWFGSAVREKRAVRISLPLAAAAVAAGLFVVLCCLGYLPVAFPWGLKYLAYCPIAAALSLLLCRIPANRVTDFFGKRSLEIYLLFERIQEVLAMKVWMEVFFGKTGIVFTGIVLGLTLLGAWILGRICAIPGKWGYLRQLT